jgi:dienelactone hydrolase
VCLRAHDLVLAEGVKAAVAEVVELGVVDPARVAAGGHSYGAFMTANILAHCGDLFACGIAQSGAYNRTLTPFGFQAEQRTFWDAPDVYSAMAPFNNADKIKKPLLLIHGENDNNSGVRLLRSSPSSRDAFESHRSARLVCFPLQRDCAYTYIRICAEHASMWLPHELLVNRLADRLCTFLLFALLATR